MGATPATWRRNRPTGTGECSPVSPMSSAVTSGPAPTANAAMVATSRSIRRSNWRTSRESRSRPRRSGARSAWTPAGAAAARRRAAYLFGDQFDRKPRRIPDETEVGVQSVPTRVDSPRDPPAGLDQHCSSRLASGEPDGRQLPLLRAWVTRGDRRGRRPTSIPGRRVRSRSRVARCGGPRPGSLAASKVRSRAGTRTRREPLESTDHVDLADSCRLEASNAQSLDRCKRASQHSANVNRCARRERRLVVSMRPTRIVRPLSRRIRWRGPVAQMCG